MTITRLIQRATRENRAKQHRAELRIDERLDLDVARGQLTAEWSDADRLGDERFNRLARAAYATLTTPEQRTAMERLYSEWTRDETIEARLIQNAQRHNLATILRHNANTPVFVEQFDEGAYVPSGSSAAA